MPTRRFIVPLLLAALVFPPIHGLAHAARAVDDTVAPKVADQPRLTLVGDYDVDPGQGGGTWHSPGGLPPPPKCDTICSSDYHSCVADCFRGAIETMGGCLAGCRVSYCQTVCE